MQESIADLKKFLIDYINIPTVDATDCGAAEFLSDFLHDSNFSVEIIDFDGVKSVYAAFGNGQGPNLLFAGHQDVVPTGDELLWLSPPFDAQVIDGVLYGRGAVDMKGATASFVFAARDFIASNPDFNGTISILITGDEEVYSVSGMQKVLPYLESKGLLFDFAIIGEPTSILEIGDTIKIGRRGSINYQLGVIGKQGHVAHPQFAENPISILAKILSDLADYNFDDGNESFEPTHLEPTSWWAPSGASNVIPANATANFNIRFNTEQTPESLREHLDGLFSNYTDSYVLTERVSGLPFINDPGERGLFMQDIVEKNTGIRPQFSTTGGTSDARFLKDYCQAFVEIGLRASTAHQIDEHVPLSDLETLTTIYGDYIASFFGVVDI